MRKYQTGNLSFSELRDRVVGPILLVLVFGVFFWRGWVEPIAHVIGHGKYAIREAWGPHGDLIERICFLGDFQMDAFKWLLYGVAVVSLVLGVPWLMRPRDGATLPGFLELDRCRPELWEPATLDPEVKGWLVNATSQRDEKRFNKAVWWGIWGSFFSLLVLCGPEIWMRVDFHLIAPLQLLLTGLALAGWCSCLRARYYALRMDEWLAISLAPPSVNWLRPHPWTLGNPLPIKRIQLERQACNPQKSALENVSLYFDSLPVLVCESVASWPILGLAKALSQKLGIPLEEKCLEWEG